ncbi:MAG: hypothetical protein K5769_06270 [Pseudobutyrivibrio sp.]|nr:hypothetical protein [Pseudobutyrivibrio sp.]
MKRLICGLCCLVAICLTVLFNESTVYAKQEAAGAAGVQMNLFFSNDSIVNKYRTYEINGRKVVQYRRWNETQGYWVDKSWITMS